MHNRHKSVKGIKLNGKNKIIALAIVLVLLVVGYFAKDFIPTGFNESVEGNAEFHIIDIGQGDASLIMCGGKTMLVDTGVYDERHNLIDYIAQYTATIDYFVLTHPDSDHIGGAATVIRTFDVKNVIMTDVTSTTSAYRSLLDALEESATVNVIEAKAGQIYELGSLVCKLLTPIEGVGADYSKNNSSIVMRLDFGETSFLYTGDAEREAERDIIAEYGNTGVLDVDFLKVGHHGSSSSSTSAFLTCVSPQLASISCGRNNSYGHPHKEIISRLDSFDVEYYRTDLEGSIVFVSDGKNIIKK